MLHFVQMRHHTYNFMVIDDWRHKNCLLLIMNSRKENCWPVFNANSRKNASTYRQKQEEKQCRTKATYLYICTPEEK